jgi:hypothetical protein
VRQGRIVDAPGSRAEHLARPIFTENLEGAAIASAMNEITKPREGYHLRWFVEIEEVSPGVYRLHAVDQAGRSFGMTGTDPDALLEECRKYAAQLKGENRSI